MRRHCLLLVFVAAIAGSSPAVLALNAAEVFAKTRHAIFLVIVTSDDPGVVDVVSQGSAVLIAPGRFVTNCHVLESGKNIVVSRSEDKIIERALLVNFEKGKDLCELDLAQMKSGFDRPVEMAPPDSVQIGATAFAIGSPRGMELTISNGIVSGIRDFRTVKVLQTTASISPGSSGGGLFDDQGRLIGITTFLRKDAQNVNFAISAQYIPSAGMSAADILKQRSSAARSENVAATEIAFERQERLRRQEQDTIAERKKLFDTPQTAPTPDKPAAPRTTADVTPAAPRKPVATRLAPYQSLGDGNQPARIYDQLAKKGQLAGLDDDAAIRKVYEVLIRQHVAEQLRWNEGGPPYVAEFQIQLRRSGEVMFVLPARPSGVERFDKEAQRAIGAASPLPVPQDNDAFAKMSELIVAVQTPERVPRTPPATPAKPPKEKSK